VELTRRGGDDPRRCLELGDGQFALTVCALLERELVLERGQPHLAVGEERLAHDHGQQRRHHQGDSHDVQKP
jgi:hypothetical protein